MLVWRRGLNDNLPVTKDRVKPFKERFLLLCATGLGAGRFSLAPGSAGTLVAIPLWAAGGGSGWAHAALLGAVLAISVPAITTGIRHEGRDDPPAVVIDEVAGMLLAATGVPWGWGNALLLFLLFRLFDIVKVGPVAWADRRKGPFFVLLDDLIAGVFANLVFRGISWGLARW